MSKYIFYNPRNLKAMGMSDDATSMAYPYISVADDFHSTEGFDLKKVDGKIVVAPKELVVDNFAKETGYHDRRVRDNFLPWKGRMDAGRDIIKSKVTSGQKITIDDLVQFILQSL